MSHMKFMLGADDPEMSAIENLLEGNGIPYFFAVTETGSRVLPANAYQSYAVRRTDGVTLSREESVEIINSAVLVECEFPGVTSAGQCDHHRPGDVGFSRPPSEYWEASSIGQVAAFLDGNHGHDILSGGDGKRLALIAAADHCLAAAMAGRCPGVDPEELADWQITTACSASAASSRGEARTHGEVRASVDRAKVTVKNAPVVTLGWQAECDGFRGGVFPSYEGAANDGAWNLSDGGTRSYRVFPVTASDLRGVTVPDLPIAAMMMGVAYIAGGTALREGEEPKVVIGGCGEGSVPGTAPVIAFLGWWAEEQGITGEKYGDPVRGFAGRYLD